MSSQSTILKSFPKEFAPRPLQEKLIEEIQEKIFVPNFTTKSKGMGLGLAMVKNIIKNHGGEIWFKTKRDVGTTFYLTFKV